MRSGPARRRQNPFQLVRRLVIGAISLGKLEMEQAKAELSEMAAETKAGIALIAAGVVIVLIAIATLDIVIILAFDALFAWMSDLALAIFFGVVFLVLLVLYVPLMGSFTAGQRVALVIGFVALAAGFAVPAWFGFRAAFHTALFVLVVQLAVVPLLAVRGIRRIRIGPPEHTIASVKEDIEWAKSRLLKRS
jgi:4-amino-4-deoxy-L-arabinose transferase-like glycosyltransferase